MAFDDSAIKVSPIPKRSVTFEVTKQDAQVIFEDLNRIADLEVVQGTPGIGTLRRIRAAFASVANEREFGGH